DSDAANGLGGTYGGQASAFNQLAQETGVVVSEAEGGALILTTVGYGSDEFIKIEKVAGSATGATVGSVTGASSVGTAETAFGTAATVLINGEEVELGGEFGNVA